MESWKPKYLDTSGEYWYRFSTYKEGLGYVTEWDDFISTGHIVKIRVDQYLVVKHTPKGVWLDLGWRKRFVLRDSRKQFACPTLELARDSFIARKQRQICILKGNLKDAEDALRIAQTKELGTYRKVGNV